MANKRMFSLSIIDTDKFLEMPLTSRYLYYELGMRGDDDGFVGNPRKILRSTGCRDDDLRKLVEMGYVRIFESGVLVIRDWKINNNIRSDRYQPTIYIAEKAEYERFIEVIEGTGQQKHLGIPPGIPPGIPTVCIEQDSIGKNSTTTTTERAGIPPGIPTVCIEQDSIDKNSTTTTTTERYINISKREIEEIANRYSIRDIENYCRRYGSINVWRTLVLLDYESKHDTHIKKPIRWFKRALADEFDTTEAIEWWQKKKAAEAVYENAMASITKGEDVVGYTISPDSPFYAASLKHKHRREAGADDGTRK